MNRKVFRALFVPVMAVTVALTSGPGAREIGTAWGFVLAAAIGCAAYRFAVSRIGNPPGGAR